MSKPRHSSCVNSYGPCGSLCDNAVASAEIFCNLQLRVFPVQGEFATNSAISRPRGGCPPQPPAADGASHCVVCEAASAHTVTSGLIFCHLKPSHLPFSILFLHALQFSFSCNGVCAIRPIPRDRGLLLCRSHNSLSFSCPLFLLSCLFLRFSSASSLR